VRCHHQYDNILKKGVIWARKNGNIDRTEMTEQAVIFKDVEDTTHLAEDQNTGPFGPHIPEQFIENDHLS
jgi:hypothetical protein